MRNRSGVSLTPAERRFHQHAKSLVLTVEQARHDVGLSSRFRGSIRIGGRVALWEGFGCGSFETTARSQKSRS